MIHRRYRSLGGVLVAALVFAACSNTTSSPAASGAAASAPAASAPAASAPAASGSASTTPSSAASSAAASAPAQSDKRIVYASRDTVDLAWAPETDDAFTLTSAGVAQTLTQTDFDWQPRPDAGHRVEENR